MKRWPLCRPPARPWKKRAKADPAYEAEVPVVREFVRSGYRFRIEGRMDGIFRQDNNSRVATQYYTLGGSRLQPDYILDGIQAKMRMEYYSVASCVCCS